MECPEGKSLPLSDESSSSRRDYEVFLSFRGPDTRLTITDSLYAAMIRAGICVFKDDEELRVGEEIGGELLRAISNSKIYVPIFSKKYASSKWCLRELAHVVECRKRYKKVILPIFYGVDASYLKLKTGSYGNALRKHERQFGEDMAKQWEEALREVAGIKGYNLKDHGQDKLIALVLEEVSGKLMPMHRNWCDGLVGIHDQIETIMKLLAVGTPDVRFVVIHGMGGIGKTTLVKAIFKRISSQFQSCSFLSNIRESDILNLQKKLLHDILGIQHPKVFDANEGRDVIKQKLNDKKAFIVLDDMDKRDKLINVAGESSWFGSGSRIIITTRNISFLIPETETLDDNIIPMHHRDFYFHEMKELRFYHALQLFSKHSFESDSPPHDYIKVSCEIVGTTGGLPLALEVIGSLLHSKGKKTWKETLKKLKEGPNQDVQKKLLISYEELEYEQKQIFLDIACHCIGEERIPTYYMWKACDFFPHTGLRVLIHLSLIKLKDDRLWMHDQLRDLGREIVRQECFTVPEMRSRLWCPTIALDVVKNNLGTDKIVALKLTSLGDGHNFTSGEFSRLHSLRFLELNGGNFVGDFKNLLSNLTWLSWHHCPSNLEATSLCLRNLAVLKLLESDISEDWNGWGACMVNDNLKVIYLASCNYLKRTPDFSKCPNLKKLVLQNCIRLEEIDSSIDQLGRLKYLEIYGSNHLLQRNISPAIPPLLDSIGGMKSLLVPNLVYQDGVRKLPPSIGELLVGLKNLSLRECYNLRELPDSIGKLRSLLHLDLIGTGISALPDSIGELRSLLHLDLKGTGISALPDSIGRLESLHKLDVSSTPITELPHSIGNLKQLKLMILSSSKIRKLPKSIGTLENLEELIAYKCDNLKGEIPSEIAGLSQLEILDLSWTKISRLPMTINRLFNLIVLNLWHCTEFQLLPNLPTSVETLNLSSSSLQAVPDLSNLTNLDSLTISDSDLTTGLYIIKRGQIVYPNLECLGRLHRLSKLEVIFSDSNMHPIDLSALSQLEYLEITCADLQSLTGLPSSLIGLFLKGVKTPIAWSLFSNLGNMSILGLSVCPLREIEFDSVLGQLENLERVEVYKGESLVRISNVSSLKEHQLLGVDDCPQLIEIASERPSIGDYSSTERPNPDTPKLEKLGKLMVDDCESLQKIPIARTTRVRNCPLLGGTWFSKL